MARQIRLKVIKADGMVEEYLHTKVLGTISHAMAAVEQADIQTAEQLAEVVTFYLYHTHDRRDVSSGEILSMVKAVLSGTGYQEAAIALTEHNCYRKLKRSRIEVVSADIQQLSDAERICSVERQGQRGRWEKSRIVEDLVTNYSVCPQTARMIASMVEEKIFGMGISVVTTSLIKQLLWGDTAAVMRAHRELQMV